jgi:hypothetical protein
MGSATFCDAWDRMTHFDISGSQTVGLKFVRIEPQIASIRRKFTSLTERSDRFFIVIPYRLAVCLNGTIGGIFCHRDHLENE